ncbi:hypothetical protein, conserved [Leishmania tarentolae]|uniref:Uncharacterized protein n=1 Tax=Leishmania tarentolae TaxID=5689 RepID=A0A640KN87_LEITA|nr:hypothetical protein, conserved [Leishmania tarentolae]
MFSTREPRCASSPFSAISVSSSSPNTTLSSTEPSQFVTYTGKSSNSNCILDEAVLPRTRHSGLYADASLTQWQNSTDGRQHQLLVYVAPSTARQFVSLSSAQTYLLRRLSGSRGNPLSTTDDVEGEAGTHGRALRGGHWCIAYEVDVGWREAVSARSDTETASTHRSLVFWCFTLEPLPKAQLAMCREALRACISVPSGTVAADRTAPRQCAAASSMPMYLQKWMLHEILVTPLYVCVNPVAVAPLNTSADLFLVRRLASSCVPVDAAEAAGAASAALDAFLRDSPTCGALVYAILQQQQQRTAHETVGPPLSIVDSCACVFAERSNCTQYEEVLAADVYVSAVSALPPVPLPTRSSGTCSSAVAMQLTASPSAPHERREDEILDHNVEAWAGTLSRHLLRRWARLRAQSVLCCGERQATLRHRRGLVLRHVADSMGATAAASSAQFDSCARRLRAALYLLDTLRPAGSVPGGHIRNRGEGNSSVVVDALDVVLEDCEDDAGRGELPEVQRRYRLVRGCVRRVAAFAPAATLRCPANGSRLTPEPDYLRFPWCAAHSAALTLTAAQVCEAPFSTPSRAPMNSASSAPTALHPHMSLSELDACMSSLQFTAEQQTCLHELTYSVVYLSSLTFISQKGSSAGPAVVSSKSMPALTAAAQLLRLPASELAAALTTVTAREDGQSASVAKRHALNCSGAMQMQRSLVVHLGGLVVRTLVYLINAALRRDRHVGTETRTFTVSTIVDAEDTALREPHTHMPNTHNEYREGSGCGLTEWYAAYLRCHASIAVRNRLVGALKREVCYEGVELDVDCWLDELSSPSTASTTTQLQLHRVAAEVRDVATRVRMPSANQRGRDTIVTADMAAGAYDLVDTACEIPVMAELAHILEEVTLRCIGTDTFAAPSLSSLEAVQSALAEQLQALAASTCHAVASEEADTSAREKEVVCTWEGTACADSSACDGALLLTFPCGMHPPLRLSVRCLAADIFTAARLCVTGTTPAIQEILCGVSKRCTSLISTGVSPDDERGAELRMWQSALCHVYGSRDREEVMSASPLISPCSAHEALQSILPLRYRPRSSIASIAMNAGQCDRNTTPVAPDFLYVLLAVPVPADTVRWESLPDVGGPDQERWGLPGAYPFLEPVPPSNAPMPFAPAVRAALTSDDALASHLHERDPLLLALFLWSRLCHCHVCPMSVFAKVCAVPLLTSYAQWRPPTSVPPQRTATTSLAAVESREDFMRESTVRSVADTASCAAERGPQLCASAMMPGEAASRFMKRVRHLQRRARYRELCLLAVTEVPCCRDGGVVLGVSAVFLRSAAVAAIQSCCAELHEMAGQRLQKTGRGFLARRHLFIAQVEQRQKSMHGHHGSPRLTHGRLGNSVAAASTEMRVFEALERTRDAQLAQAAHERVNAVVNSTRHLSLTVSWLQQGWTQTLELLEGELVGAVMQINAYETQRRSAEDAARQEARLTLRGHGGGMEESLDRHKGASHTSAGDYGGAATPRVESGREGQ